MIAVTYLMQDIGSRLFRGLTGAPGDMDLGWTGQQYLISTAIHTVSLLLRLLFWLRSWSVLRSYLAKITSNLTTKMWMIIDVLMLAPFIAIFTIIYFLPEGSAIVYPICSASIFSSFGCIYLASYTSEIQQSIFMENLPMYGGMVLVFLAGYLITLIGIPAGLIVGFDVEKYLMDLTVADYEIDDATNDISSGYDPESQTISDTLLTDIEALGTIETTGHLYS